MGPLGILSRTHHPYWITSQGPFCERLWAERTPVSPQKDLSMHCRGFVSQTSTHLLPQALRFSQSNEQHCKCSGYQIHHAILSSVKMTTYPLARLIQVRQERLPLRQPKGKYNCLKHKSNMQQQASTCSKQTGLPFRGTGFGQPTNRLHGTILLLALLAQSHIRINYFSHQLVSQHRLRHVLCRT